MIETWTTPQAGTIYRWSLWADGKRIAMGGPHATLGESESEARAACAERLGRSPDRFTRL